MVEEHKNYHGKYLLTLVFASILLASFGMISHNAFADTIIATIPVGTNPSVVAINPNTNRIYVENSGEGTISVIDGASNSVLTKMAISSTAMDINKNTNMIYSISVYGSLGVSVINGSTNQVIESIPTNAGPTGITVNSNTNEIFVAETGHYIGGPAGFIQVINGTTNTVVKTISTDISNGNIVVDPNTNKVYLTSALDGSILVFDGTTYTVTAKIPGITIGELAVNPVTNRLYDTYRGDPEIIDTSTNTVLGTIPIGDATTVGVNSVTNKIYAGNSCYNGTNCNTIYVINGSTNTIVQRLQVGSDNRQTIGDVQIGVNPNTNKIYVVNFNNNTVSVIDGSSPNISTVPSAPQNLQATTVSSSQINLSWTAPSNNGGSPITGYMIERSIDNGSTWSTLISNTGSTATTFNDTGLAAKTTYTYRVSAINSAGTSVPSNQASATTLQTPTLSVAVLTNKQSYLQNSTAFIKVSVSSNSSPTSGASVTLRACTPNNSCLTKTATTNSNGIVIFQIKIPLNAPMGTYTASTTASLSGYISGNAKTTFQVT